MNRHRLSPPLLTRLLLAISLCLAFSSLSNPGRAARLSSADSTQIVVNTTDDELNTDGDCSLREAVRAANLNTAVDGCPAGSGADIIVLSPGTYLITIPGNQDDQALTGDLDLTDDVLINGTNVSTTIVDGNDLDRVFEVNGNITVRFSNLTIRNGTSPAVGLYGGGGILIWSGSTVEFYNCAILDNTSEKPGGAIDNSGNARFYFTEISGNTSTVTGTGGGIFNVGTVIVSGVLFTENNAELFGGGLYNDGTATLTNVTFSGNSSPNGGGLLNNDVMDMTNTTFASNTNAIFQGGGAVLRITNTIIANSSAGNNCVGTINIVSLGYNLDSADSCQLRGFEDLYNTNPQLGPLANNQGPTYTHALLAGSPAIDSGNDFECPASDQRGAIRPADGDGNGDASCDRGAYEHNGAFPTYTYLPFLRK